MGLKEEERKDKGRGWPYNPQQKNWAHYPEPNDSAIA